LKGVQAVIFDSEIWEATVAAAKAKAARCPTWLRAIDRAVIEIEKARYWGFADGVLTIISTTSGKRYVVGAEHTCEARGICKHRAARRLMIRYIERLSATASAPEEIVATALPQADERAQLIADIKAAWHRARPFASLSYGVHQVFGARRLEDVSTDDLRRVLAALAPHNHRQPVLAARPINPIQPMEVNYA
jgi:hypothetical protein